jgi:glycine/D-amino acid oxidase-like deaminating enzyme
MIADAIVIGAGFFGCETALELVRLGFSRVLIAEREAEVLRRSSFVNQARVHNGYHYPRSFATAVRSRNNFENFVSEYADAVMHDVETYYAIARGSRNSADQFASFCNKIGAYCSPAGIGIEQLFEPGTVERIFRVRELAFDTVKLAARLRAQILSAGIDLRLNSPARVIAIGEHGVDVDVAGRVRRARYVFNCTYAALECVGVDLRTRIKKELAEMILIKPPPQLHKRGFTMIDGPFFSTMPFPAAGLHTLSHVRYTPHEASVERDGSTIRPTKSNATAMLRDASRYMPCLSHSRIVGSMFEIKAVLLRSETDDGRPILIERSEGSGRVLSVLGAKIDNIYELRRYLRNQAWT